jgi:hypothetical protein
MDELLRDGTWRRIEGDVPRGTDPAIVIHTAVKDLVKHLH